VTGGFYFMDANCNQSINQSFIREHRQQAIMTRNTGKHESVQQDSKAKGTNN